MGILYILLWTGSHIDPALLKYSSCDLRVFSQPSPLSSRSWCKNTIYHSVKYSSLHNWTYIFYLSSISWKKLEFQVTQFSSNHDFALHAALQKWTNRSSGGGWPNHPEYTILVQISHKLLENICVALTRLHRWLYRQIRPRGLTHWILLLNSLRIPADGWIQRRNLGKHSY